MVVLTEDDDPYRSLRIIIGPTEANAVLAGWRGAVPGRPSTWDLFVSTVALLGGRIDRVVITAVQEERHYFAHIEIEQAGERRILACRPSDAVALAVRSYNADILAEADVLDAAGVLPDGTKPGRPVSADGDDPAAVMAEREAALAAREAALAARERALADAAGRADGPGAAVAAPQPADLAEPEPADLAEPVILEPAEAADAAGPSSALEPADLAEEPLADPATGPPATPG